MSLAFTSFVFDKNIYAPGEPVQLTVTYTSDDLNPGTSVVTAVSVALSNAAGTVSQVSDGSASFPDLTVETPSGTPLATSVSATDPRPGTWTLISNVFSGSAAPFTGTAVLTSVA
jgi:hypothetical protein